MSSGRLVVGRQNLVVVAFLLAVAAVAGCRSGRSTPEGLSPVSGTITLDGKPVEGAMVSFIPQKVADVMVNPAGVTDAQGKYELMADDVPGALPGEYKVVISRLAMADGKAVQISKDKPPLTLFAAGAKETLPKTYSEAMTTTLKATVPEGGATIDFPLKASGEKAN